MKKGFPLWGLMLVILVVGLVDAFVIPHVIAKRYAASELTIAGMLPAYASAQEMYRKMSLAPANGDEPGAYAASFRYLSGPEAHAGRKGETLALMPEGFAAATKENGFRGHFFVDAAEDLSGEPIDPRQDFGLFAHPCEYGVTGKLSYCVFADGVVRCADAGADLPAGTGNPPACAGRWKPVEGR